jgi:hypothetical protein
MWRGFPIEGHVADMSLAKEALLAKQGYYTVSNGEWITEAVSGDFSSRMNRYKVHCCKKKAMKAMKDHARMKQLLDRRKHADDMLCTLRNWIFDGCRDTPNLDQLCKVDDRLVMLANASWEMRRRAPDMSLRELCRIRKMAKKVEKAKKATESAASSSSCAPVPRNRQWT